MTQLNNIISKIKFNERGLVPVIAQDAISNEILMMAWMNEEALRKTLISKQMCYFSRSRNQLWEKGLTSGHTQELIELILDCDSDTILAKIKQKGAACHTGRRSCFFKTIRNDDINNDIVINQDVIAKTND
jgi:phosphoribosyl-AMP cyclohydrolase